MHHAVDTKSLPGGSQATLGQEGRSQRTAPLPDQVDIQLELPLVLGEGTYSEVQYSPVTL